LCYNIAEPKPNELKDLMIKLTHTIVDLLHQDEITSLFENCLTIDTFCANMERLAGQSTDDSNMFKGDVFELFVEFLLKRNGLDTRIGIKNYQVMSARHSDAEPDEYGELPDHGVDGFGEAIVGEDDGKPLTVQVKYRHRHDIPLTPNEGSLGNFCTQSRKDFLDPKELFPYRGCMLVVTTCSGLHHIADDMYSNHKGIWMRCIGWAGLQQLANNIPDFWATFQESILTSRTPLRPGTPITLREHQTDGIGAIVTDIRDSDGKGQVILPTGSGKTYIQADAIIKAAQEFGYRTCVVFSSRIALSFQLLREIAQYHISNSFEAEYLNVNSGDFDGSLINEKRAEAGIVASRIRSTTSAEEIGNVYRRALAIGKPLVISCTYHSAERIREAGIPIDLQLNDEAHNVVSEDFNSCHGIGRSEFSFTATRRITDSDNGLGMNNEELFGDVVFEKLPKELIDVGEILGVAMHGVETQADVTENDYDGIMAAIEACFVEHRKLVHQYSADASQIAPKMLTVLDGQRTMEGILNCRRFNDFRERFQHIKIFAIASDLGAYIDGEWSRSSSRTKDTFLRALQQLGPTDETIIMHINMLGEGVDVPGITGVLPLCGLGDTSAKQLVGRAMRLWPEDRQNFYAEKISPTNKQDYIKPHAWLIVPRMNIGSVDTAARLRRIWGSLYSSHRNPERVVLSHYNGINDEGDLEDVNQLDHEIQQADPELREWVHSVMWPQGNDIHESWLLSAYGENPELVVDVLFHYFGITTDRETFVALAELHKAESLTIGDLITMSRNAGQGSFNDEIKKKFGTIYTPDFVIEKTVDLALKHYKDDLLSSTFCDPAAGDGNFLAYLYEKLMAVESSMTPAEQSRHILTHCLNGVEIIENMVKATKIRLLLLHLKVEKLDSVGARELLDSLNIHHGNTICLPADVEEEWYSNRESWEGDLLPEAVRERKYDVIVGNPPYTHLRNLNNRRYTSYPKQRDMAQVFVRWALDHLTENGVCGYNTTDAWLNAKTNGGAGETRKLLDCRLLEVSQTDDIKLYSISDGGRIPVMIFCFGSVADRELRLNGMPHRYTEAQLLLAKFIDSFTTIQYNYRQTGIATYLAGPRLLNGGLRFAKDNPAWDSIASSIRTGDWYVVLQRQLSERSSGHKRSVDFKLVRTSNLNETVAAFSCGANGMAEAKYLVPTNSPYAFWLFGFLNTSCAHTNLRHWSKFKTDKNADWWVYQFNNNAFVSCQVPDYDWYLENRPEQHAAFLAWIETNMRDKDTFLAGIDEQFEKLIK